MRQLTTMYKHMVLPLILVLCSVESMKLLRKPKIYNALITTKQNLLPSEAFPASTGPVFEPIQLSGDPILLNPEAFARARVDGQEPLSVESNGTKEDNQPRPFSKMPEPIIFYPRYNIYHQYPSPLLPFSNLYQQPLVFNSKTSEERFSENVQNEMENVETMQPLMDDTNIEPKQISSNAGFVTNNGPKDADIRNVPPPPPPQGAQKVPFPIL